MSLNSKPITRATLSFFIFITLFGALFQVANGQEESGWIQPANLSQSGSANTPLIVKDATGLLYAFWQNAIDGYVVSTNQNGSWSDPQIIEAPFGTTAFEENVTAATQIPLFEPALVADKEQGLHSLWVTDDFELYHSRVITGDISLLSTWSNRQRIGGEISSVKAIIDNNNALHIAYIFLGSGGQLPPGVYHRSSLDGGLTWSDPRQIYASPYFRQATDGSIQIDFVESEGDSVLLTWNDSFKEQVFFASLSSTAENEFQWSTAQIIDSRGELDNADTSGPSNINGAIIDDEVHLFWTAGHERVNCSLYTRSSSNVGGEWTAPQQLTEDSDNCPEHFDIVQNDTAVFLYSQTLNQAEIRLLQDGGWSDPVLQPQLAAFTDPVTFRNISSACPYQMDIQASNLIAVGCGVGTVEDIWITSQPVNSLKNSLTFESSWSPEQVLATADLDNVQDLNFMADQFNNVHAVWSAEDVRLIGDALASRERMVYHAFWNGEEWTQPASILASTTTPIVSVTSALTADGNLLVAWDDAAGDLFFSKSKVEQASFFSAWSEPQMLPLPIKGARYPELLLGDGDSIYMAYAIPFNESRGIYLIESEDQGDNWLPNSFLVLDGSELTVVGEPRIAISADGVFNLMALHWPRPTVENLLADIYYSRSLDYGVTWTEHALIEKNRQNASVQAVWADIKSDSTKNVHRAWQEVQNGEFELWHQFSGDRGNVWSEAVRLQTIGQPVGDPSLVIDSVDTPHLFQVSVQQTAFGDKYLLQHWAYIDFRWETNESVELESIIGSSQALTAEITNDGALIVGSGARVEVEDSLLGGFIYFSQVVENRESSSVAPIVPTAVPEELITEPPNTNETASETEPTPTRQIDFTNPEVEASNGLFIGLGSLTGSILLTILLVLPMGIIVLAVRVIRNRGW